MKRAKKSTEDKKKVLHPRNRHKQRYDFDQLIEAEPDLASFVKLNRYGDLSIDFADPLAVKMLNKALLKKFYRIDFWDIPENNLCPAIPGRSDYIHYLADLLAETYQGKIPHGQKTRVLDIGVGASLIYPIIGQREYGWSFVGSDIDVDAIANAKHIIQANNGLEKNIELRLQADSASIFNQVIKPAEYFDLTLCNPPFHASVEEAQSGTLRKLRNLGKPANSVQPILNFGGNKNELWCEGGEEAFIRQMITESIRYKLQCFWFSSLVAKQSILPAIYQALQLAGVAQVKTIEMAQGNKVSRFVAWTFLNKEQQKVWIKSK